MASDVIQLCTWTVKLAYPLYGVVAVPIVRGAFSYHEKKNVSDLRQLWYVTKGWGGTSGSWIKNDKSFSNSFMPFVIASDMNFPDVWSSCGNKLSKLHTLMSRPDGFESMTWDSREKYKNSAYAVVLLSRFVDITGGRLTSSASDTVMKRQKMPLRSNLMNLAIIEIIGPYWKWSDLIGPWTVAV